MIPPEDVTAVLVTRGDREEAVQEIASTLIFPELVVWNNASPGRDRGAYGRYVAAHALAAGASSSPPTPYVYLQDDDCRVPEEAQWALLEAANPGVFVSNMNPSHNAGMPLLALPGWGAIVTPALLAAAEERWKRAHPADWNSDAFRRIGCDIVIPVLCPSQMFDLGHESFSFAWDESRTHKQPGYAEKKAWYYTEAAKVRRAVEREAA